MSIEYSSQPSTRSGISSAAQACGFDGSRRTVILQNLGTNTLYVKFGTNATTSDFDIILKGGAAQDDGNGGIYSEDSLSYQGIISVAGTTPRYILTAF